MTNTETKEEQFSAWWKSPWNFFTETTVGVIIFAVIAIPAVLLNVALHKLEMIKADKVIVLGLTVAEYALFVVDLILFLRFLWRTAQRTWVRL